MEKGSEKRKEIRIVATPRTETFRSLFSSLLLPCSLFVCCLRIRWHSPSQLGVKNNCKIRECEAEEGRCTAKGQNSTSTAFCIIILWRVHKTVPQIPVWVRCFTLRTHFAFFSLFIPTQPVYAVVHCDRDHKWVFRFGLQFHCYLCVSIYSHSVRSVTLLCRFVGRYFSASASTQFMFGLFAMAATNQVFVCVWIEWNRIRSIFSGPSQMMWPRATQSTKERYTHTHCCCHPKMYTRNVLWLLIVIVINVIIFCFVPSPRFAGYIATACVCESTRTRISNFPIGNRPQGDNGAGDE